MDRFKLKYSGFQDFNASGRAVSKQGRARILSNADHVTGIIA